MLELELNPEKSLASDQWEFSLGMHFSQAVMILESESRVIQEIKIIYSESTPLNRDLEIDLTKDGIRLKFETVSQRLKTIEIYNLKLVKLKYCGMVFNSEEVYPTLDQIEHTFGATTPGIYIPDLELYAIDFRGVSFYFPYSKCKGAPARGVLRSGQATLVSIYPGNREAAIQEIPPLPLGFCPGEVYLSKLLVLDDLALRLQLYTGESFPEFWQSAYWTPVYSPCTSRPLEGRKETMTYKIGLGDSPQEVVSRLGAPANLYYKCEDKMKIHSIRRPVEVVGRTDYVFNYFSLGIDVLFDGRTHKVKKFVLNTNYPGHFNFNMYHRCEFLINLPLERDSGHMDKPTNIEVTPYTMWGEIYGHINSTAKHVESEEYSHCGSHCVPVVLNRSSILNNKNRFGPTLFYGYRDFIFEVMPNQHLASVIVYKSDSDF